MQIFKTALRVCFKHPVYLLIYVVALSFMAVFIGKAAAPAATKTFEAQRPSIAVIDRDGSVFSKGFIDFMSARATLVHIADNKIALQDATAQNYATWIAVIPAGFGQDFLNAGAQGKTAPRIETIVSYDSASGSLAGGFANAWLSTARAYAASGAAPRDQHELVRLITADAGKSAPVTVLKAGKTSAPSAQFVVYLSFAAYTTMMSVIVCTGLIMMAFNQTELRKRDFSSPVGTLSRNLQVAAACLVVVLISWVWVSVLGLVVFGSALAGVAHSVIALLLLSLLAHCTIPLAIGFFLGQLTANELVLNAVGNIVGMGFSFLGGIWVDLSLMVPGMRVVGRFIPTYYYVETLKKLTELKIVTASTLGPVFANLGMILLFAAAIFAVALVTGRLRMQSATAGGNAAAARSVA